MSYFGKLVISHLDRGQVEVDYWMRYRDRLTPMERSRIAGGDYAPLVRPLSPEFTELPIEVCSNLRIWLGKTRWRGRGEVTPILRVEDFRVRLPRRTPGIFELPELDSYGEPTEPTPDAIAAAREDGNYTASHALAVPEIDEAVPREYDNVLTMQSKARWAEHRRSERADETRKRELRALTSAVKETAAVMARQGLDTTPLMADLQRVLAEHRPERAA